MRRATAGGRDADRTVVGMGIDGVGSSAIIALAAVLWFIYLVPTWLRRREYLSTERNAVRLQQTLRIMAETSQVPEAVRVEAHARAVAAQERALRARRAALGDTAPVVVDRPADAQRSAPVAPRVSSASRRLRRSRSVTTLVLVAALVGAGFGVTELLASGGWVLLVASAVVAVGALALLNQMAAVARMRAAGGAVRRTVVPGELYDDAAFDGEGQPRQWTPQPIPKPLYLQARERAMAAGTGLKVEAVPAAAHVNRSGARDELRAAAAASEEALRAAQPRVPAERVADAVAPPAESRFARMGILDEQDESRADLDEILARRRAVG